MKVTTQRFTRTTFQKFLPSNSNYIPFLLILKVKKLHVEATYYILVFNIHYLFTLALGTNIKSHQHLNSVTNIKNRHQL